MFFATKFPRLLNWDFILDSCDVNHAYNLFLDKFCYIYNDCFPYHSIKRTKHDKSWLITGIISSCRTKNKLYKKSINNPTAENHANIMSISEIFSLKLPVLPNTSFMMRNLRTVMLKIHGSILMF